MTGNFHTRGDTASSGSGASSKRFYTGSQSANGFRAKGNTVETGSHRNGLRKQQPPSVSSAIRTNFIQFFV